VSARTVGLLLWKDQCLDIGSGTCVSLTGHFLVATAAHNLANISKIELTPPHRNTTLPIFRASHPRPTPAPSDVGWIELSDNVAQASGLSFISLGDLEFGARHDPQRAFFVQGYPAQEIAKLSESRLDLALLSMGVGLISLDPGPASTELVLEYPPDSDEDTGLELPHPGGMSGGGVWTVPQFDDKLVWTPSSTRLLALVRSWEKQSRRLSCVPIELWLRLVSEDFPDIGEVVMPRLQPG